MKKIFAVLLGLFLSLHAFGGECPGNWGDEDYNEKVIAAINSSFDCDEGVEIANSCGMGNSNDQLIFGQAELKCKKTFSKKKSEVTLFKELTKRCTKKYAKASGTMYLSMNAACRMNSSRIISEVNTPVE